VLWDEFDSDLSGESFGWLRHFLAPMQDGTFQQGQMIHPIGKAIFVFAGGTSVRLADFEGTGATASAGQGPRLREPAKGHVDIVGPDRAAAIAEADPYYASGGPFCCARCCCGIGRGSSRTMQDRPASRSIRVCCGHPRGSLVPSRRSGPWKRSWP